MSDFLEAGYKSTKGLLGALDGFSRANDDDATVPQRAAGGLSGAGEVLGTVGALLGGKLPVLATPAMEALGGLGLGTGLVSAGGVLGAGALGFKIGEKLDHLVGDWTGKTAHDHLSDAMTPTVDEHIHDQGQVVQSTRGTAGIAAANREAQQRAIDYTRTFPQEELERLEDQRERDEAQRSTFFGRAQAEAMRHWSE